MTHEIKDSSSPIPNIDLPPYAVIDIETSTQPVVIADIGVLRHDGSIFHKASKEAFKDFVRDIPFLCGHNIVHHDAFFLFGDSPGTYTLVDTLYLSPLLFPERPYHRLMKDDKIISEEANNPINDCRKAQKLLFDEIAVWYELPESKRKIFATLLADQKEFKGFFRMVKAETTDIPLSQLITDVYHDKICHHADLKTIIDTRPCELAYALALIGTQNHHSITPRWVMSRFPYTENVLWKLRANRCKEGCPYCDRQTDVHRHLSIFYGFDHFRTYEGEPLQEHATRAAVDGKSLLAIFPTGGGKSLAFQLPALIAGRTVRGLTVVISPLQSLMKDQVDNLANRGITEAVTINGLLDPIERANAIERVMSGDASLLYISPETLRSNTLERILKARHVVRFVIDEAHCLSAWGQDFRVDYLYIGKFIRQYCQQKGYDCKIPVSCFTATAKQKVIQDIRDYFKKNLNLDLEIYATTASRTNLRYEVIHTNDENDKYFILRNLIAEANCPVIVYVARTKRTNELATRLTLDGLEARPFNGQMNTDQKIANQEAFMNDEVGIIVATSAFGMGVDKKNVGLVIHYDISDSLENYVQEAGRAGRDPKLNARCYVLYSDSDLDKHFILLNQSKLSISEIQQIWQVIKRCTKIRKSFNLSALELAREAGWDDSVKDVETRVRSAIGALEQSGYIERGKNTPHIYATGITVKNIDEARSRIIGSKLFNPNEIEKAVRIMKSLITKKYTSRGDEIEAESRVDYLSDILAIDKKEVISVIDKMRQEGMLADSKDISAYLMDTGDSERKSRMILDRFAKLEQYIIGHIPDTPFHVSYKQLNDDAVNDGLDFSKEKDIKTLLNFLVIKGYMRNVADEGNTVKLMRLYDIETMMKKFERRLGISRFVVEQLYAKVNEYDRTDHPDKVFHFSIVELLKSIKSNNLSLFNRVDNVTIEDMEESLLYLSKIGALKLEGGFLVIYNSMNIRRIKDNKTRYKLEDYHMLNEFYKLKIQQIHIVGEYANLMVKDYRAALQYVKDYFQMDYQKFIARYFKGEREREIARNITSKKYSRLFGQLSERQMEIISDKKSRSIIVAAGPGSGKTRILVHKLASLLLLEDVKHEQMLMLTFSRAAATEFKQRLMELIGNAAHFVEIKTFHSYCFDLLGRIGNLEKVKDVVAEAADMINRGEAEPNRIGKTVLVIDEAQDMSKEEFMLVKALMDYNEDMRVIAVGDDDQNIYEFRGSNSCYMFNLTKMEGSRYIEMTENFRSAQNIVTFANAFSHNIIKRIKCNPIISVSDKKGQVVVTQYQSHNMFIPLVNDLVDRKAEGTICVLTHTNEEAVITMALLKRRGINSKLIQSLEGFRFKNMAEVKYFMNYIRSRLSSPYISDTLWREAKQITFSKYERSHSLPYLRRCIELFEQTYKTGYFTDFQEFVNESSLEDFCDISGADVVVSTIHKAKGREFDNVYMLIDGIHSKTDALMRLYYVGITRTKCNLFIHTNTDWFKLQGTNRYLFDTTPYEMPNEIVLQMSHKDVYLNYFKDIKIQVLNIQAGDKLHYRNHMLYETTSGKPVAKLSSKMRNTLSEWQQRGYEMKEATARFVVAWKPKDDPKEESETAVLLADLLLSKKTDDKDSISIGNEESK